MASHNSNGRRERREIFCVSNRFKIGPGLADMNPKKTSQFAEPLTRLIKSQVPLSAL
jgi:hypothetical protein